MISVRYTLTYEDYARALREHGLGRKLARRRGQRVPTWLRIALLLFFFVLFIALGLLSRRQGITSVSGNGPAAPTSSNFWPDLLVAMFPWFIMLIVIGTVVRRQLTGRTRMLALWMVGLFLVIAGVSAMSVWTDQSATAPNPPADSGGHTSWLWLLELVTFWAFIVWLVRALRRNSWTGMQHLHGEIAMDADDSSLTVTGPHFKTRYDWEAFLKYRDGKDVFLLYVGDVIFQIIPKRAFTEAIDLDRFSQLLETRVANITPRAGAFAVVPFARVANNSSSGAL